MMPQVAEASVQEILASLTAGPVQILISGGIGSGKSSVLEAIRRALRNSGQTVLSRPPGPIEHAATVIDDAHLLGDADLRRLTELCDDPDRTIVVASQPRDHQNSLRCLEAALERERPRIILRPLSNGETARLLADPSGHPLAPDLLAAAMTATAGIPGLVNAVATAQRPLTAAAMSQAVDFALIERLRRLDPAELDALLICSLSTDLAANDLAAVIQSPVDTVADLIDRARGTGLIQPSQPSEFRRSVHRAVAHLVGAARHHELETALLRTQLASTTLSFHLGLELAEHGVRDAELAHWLAGQAETVPADPSSTARIYRAAVDAGAADMRAGLADALAVDGDARGAAILADDLLSSAATDERAAGVRIAASIAALDGNYAHAEELFGWLGPYPDAAVASAAALVHAATGDLAAARAALVAGHAGPPTAAARSARSLAEGVLLTVDGSYPAAAPRLGQALAGEQGRSVAMPDSAAALVTLTALNSGDSVRARSVIGRAVRQGREPVFTARHRLLQGWVRMQDGQLATATADADAAAVARGGRDELWVAALRTAVARRSGDAGALQAHWSAGMDTLAEYSIDLFSLLPLGELWIAAARLRQPERMAGALEQGFAVLTALGNPPAWAPSLHWAGVHAGILAGDPTAVAPHGQALTAMAEHSAFAAALAAAGRTWLRVLANQVHPDEVIAAARGLAGFGLTSDATRLAGQAALQAQDARISGLMLQAARELKLSVGTDSDLSADSADAVADRRPRPVSTALSDREREVAELLLLGMPYRDIGGQLFISAKTVEHHVARIRRRLGAESRSEMLSMLRALMAVEESPASPNSRA
jgi:DNA-binding CsgD family transcriptional regulator